MGTNSCRRCHMNSQSHSLLTHIHQTHTAALSHKSIQDHTLTHTHTYIYIHTHTHTHTQTHQTQKSDLNPKTTPKVPTKCLHFPKMSSFSLKLKLLLKKTEVQENTHTHTHTHTHQTPSNVSYKNNLHVHLINNTYVIPPVWCSWLFVVWPSIRIHLKSYIKVDKYLWPLWWHHLSVTSATAAVKQFRKIFITSINAHLLLFVVVIIMFTYYLLFILFYMVVPYGNGS